jgi:hypothetical protein
MEASWIFRFLFLRSIVLPFHYETHGSDRPIVDILFPLLSRRAAGKLYSSPFGPLTSEASTSLQADTGFEASVGAGDRIKRMDARTLHT